MWKPQVPAFKDHYKLIRFDNRGAGKSDKPRGPYSIKTMTEDTIGLMDYLGIDKAIILGLSMGGMIAQEIAINYPQRVIKLVLCGTYASRDRDNGLTAEAEKLNGLPNLKRLSVFLSLCFSSPFRRLFYFILLSLTINKTKIQGIEAQGVACGNHNALERLHFIKAPTLVIVGTNDRMVRPSSSKVLASKIAQAKLVEITNGSHTINMEMTKAFNTEVLNFLRSQ